MSPASHNRAEGAMLPSAPDRSVSAARRKTHFTGKNCAMPGTLKKVRSRLNANGPFFYLSFMYEICMELICETSA